MLMVVITKKILKIDFSIDFFKELLNVLIKISFCKSNFSLSDVSNVKFTKKNDTFCLNEITL